MTSLLVVEDDRPTHALFVALIRRCGCEARSAFDGRSALRQVRGQRPDGIILDLLLPEMDGFQFLSEMDRFAPDLVLRTIVVTAASELLFEGCVQMRLVRNVMRKPFNIEELEKDMLSMLDGRPAAQRARAGGPMRLKIS
ncbi:MAG TPA: response regulator [Thermoanaerobaculia bacterium]|nr:response regulator [Thermoanaerobaculia bacterium]